MKRNNERKGNHSYLVSQISHILNHLGFEYSPQDIQFYAHEFFRFPISKVGVRVDDRHAYMLRSLKPRVFTSSLDKLFEAMDLPINTRDFNLSAEDLGYQV